MSEKRPSSTSTPNEKRNLLLAHELLVSQEIATNTAATTSALSGISTAANQTTEIARLTSILADTTEIKENTNDALGGEGTEFIPTLSVITGKTYKYIVINEDATFTTLVDDATVDLLTDLNITTSTITKGMIIRAKSGKLIEDVTLATGTAIGIL
jgi:hypothetical protein